MKLQQMCQENSSKNSKIFPDELSQENSFQMSNFLFEHIFRLLRNHVRQYNRWGMYREKTKIIPALLTITALQPQAQMGQLQSAVRNIFF